LSKYDPRLSTDDLDQEKRAWLNWFHNQHAGLQPSAGFVEAAVSLRD
jgi:hypothetical protein